MCFSKRTTDATATPDGDDTVIVVVNVDPRSPRETLIHLDLPALGYDWSATFAVTDEITGQTWRWGERNYVRLDPAQAVAHIASVRRA